MGLMAVVAGLAAVAFGIVASSFLAFSIGVSLILLGGYLFTFAALFVMIKLYALSVAMGIATLWLLFRRK